MIPLHPQWCCMQSTVLLEGCRTWSTVFSWVLHTEHSALTGCCTQSTVLLQSAAHRAQYSHRGAAHRAQYSHRVLHTKHSAPTWVLDLENSTPTFSQGATHRTQSLCRVLHPEHSTPPGCYTWSRLHTEVIHTEHSTPAMHLQEDTLQEFQAEIPQSVTV